MAFILQQEDSRHCVVGECYVDGLMDGEAVIAMREKRRHRGFIDPAEFLSRFLNRSSLGNEEREITDSTLQDVLIFADRKYSELKPCYIDLY